MERTEEDLFEKSEDLVGRPLDVSRLGVLFGYYYDHLIGRLTVQESRPLSQQEAGWSAPSVEVSHLWRHLQYMCEEGKKMLVAGQVDEARAQLAFVQGVLWMRGHFSMRDIVEHLDGKMFVQSESAKTTFPSGGDLWHELFKR